MQAAAKLALLAALHLQPAAAQTAPPAAPTGLSCTAGGSSVIRLEWTPPPGPKVDTYHVLYGPASAPLGRYSLTTAAAAATLYDLPAPGTNWSVQVRAHAGEQGLGADAEWGPMSAAVKCATHAVPHGAPSGLRSTAAAASPANISVAWTPPAGGGSSSCTVHGRLQSAGAGPLSPMGKSTGAAAAVLTGLKPGSTYELQVQCSGAGSSDVVAFRTAAVGSRYTTMYRITENGAEGQIDWLSSHNSADYAGSAAFLSFAFAHSDTLGPAGLNSSTGE
eukprot:SAG22_NODE_222_length_14768_cov_6.358920_5_plen_277_part_00